MAFFEDNAPAGTAQPRQYETQDQIKARIRREHPEWYNPDGTLKQELPPGVSRTSTTPAPGTTAPTAPGTTAPTGGDGDYSKPNDELEAILKKYQANIDPTNPDSIRQLVEALKADGYPAELGADGLTLRVKGYDAGWVDPRADKAFVEGRGEIRGWAFQPYYGSEDFKRLTAQGRNPHTGAQALPGQVFSRDQDAPIAGPGSIPPGYQVGTFTGGGRYPLSSVMGTGLAQPWTTPFQAPTVTDDPGYAWRMGEAQKALEKSAAAKGTMRTGGFVKDLAGHMQGLASQEYANAYDRARGEYEMAYGIYGDNKRNLYNQLYGISGQGLDAAKQSSGERTDLITGIGNTRANEIINKNNATQGALGSLGDVVSTTTGAVINAKTGGGDKAPPIMTSNIKPTTGLTTFPSQATLVRKPTMGNVTMGAR